MADIAAIFHWPLSSFEEIGLDDLMKWRELAIERAKLLMGGGDAKGAKKGR